MNQEKKVSSIEYIKIRIYMFGVVIVEIMEIRERERERIREN